MIKNSLGLIEVVGLAGALEAADAAVKAANVRLLGYELSKGGGMVVIKLHGDVGAVKAAVEAGTAAARKISRIVSAHVIARPHNDLAGIVATKDTVGLPKPSKAAKAVPAAPAGPAAKLQPELTLAAGAIPGRREENSGAAGGAGPDTAKKKDEICNLCGDPECSRKKGDPKVTCIHYDKHNKEDE